jgi:hypothetical protein
MVRIPDDALGDRDMASAYMLAMTLYQQENPGVSMATKPWRWLTSPAVVAVFAQPTLMDRMDLDPRDAAQVLMRARKMTGSPTSATFIEVAPRLEGTPGRSWPSVLVPLDALKQRFAALRQSPALDAFVAGAATSGPANAAAEARRAAFVRALEDDDVAFAYDNARRYVGPDPSLIEQAKQAAAEVGDAIGAAAGGAIGAASSGIGAALTAAWREIPTPVKLGAAVALAVFIYGQTRRR